MIQSFLIMAGVVLGVTVFVAVGTFLLTKYGSR